MSTDLATSPRYAPYATLPSVNAVLRHLLGDEAEVPLSVEVVAELRGVTPSLAPRAFQAAKLLDLIDGNGYPTPLMAKLRDSDNRAGVFGVILAQGVYKPVFERFDVSDADPEEIFDFFGATYKPSSMTDRMVRLFYGLCKVAGLVDEVPRIAGMRTRKRQAAEAADGDSDVEEAGDADEVRETAQGTVHRLFTTFAAPVTHEERLPDIVAAIVAKLPDKGESWTAEEFDWWLDMLRLAVPREYGFVPDRSGGYG